MRELNIDLRKEPPSREDIACRIKCCNITRVIKVLYCLSMGVIAGLLLRSGDNGLLLGITLFILSIPPLRTFSRTNRRNYEDATATDYPGILGGLDDLNIARYVTQVNAQGRSLIRCEVDRIVDTYSAHSYIHEHPEVAKRKVMEYEHVG